MKNSLFCSVFIVFSLSFSSVFSQRVVEGKILAENNKAAIPYATIQAEGNSEFVYADEKGNFKIPISNETLRLIVSSAGFTKKYVTIPPQAQKITLDITLKNTNFGNKEPKKGKENPPKTEPSNATPTASANPKETETPSNLSIPKPINLNEIRQKMIYPSAVGEIEGNVIARVLIDENGNYIKHFIINEAHPLFVKEVEKHIQEIKFNPLVQNEKAVKFSVNIPFNFTVK